MLLSSLLFLLSTVMLFDCVPGNQIVIEQTEVTNSDDPPTWIVKGIASYEHGGGSPKIFTFTCTSPNNNGKDLIWLKVGGPVGGSQTSVSGTLQLTFNPPLITHAGTYICRDTVLNEEVRFILTDQSPAALAAYSSLVHYVGDTATIEMYASDLEPITTDDILWKKDNKDLSEDMLSNDHKTLTIPDVQLSDAGVYKFIVVIGNGHFTFTATANTTLQVLEPPLITEHPNNYQTNKEWESVQFTCTATASLSLSISWYKVNGELPSSSTIINNTTNPSNTTSTLTITELRSEDSGIYYCTASDGTRSNSSNNATLIVTNNSRLTYTSQGDSSTQQILSDPFLFLPEPGVIDCEGSGPLSWNGPSMISVPTSIGDSNVYQYTVNDTGFRRLNLTSLDAFPDGLYTCLSTVNRSVYLTNDNPAVYTETREVNVGTITDTVLQVYVSGANPTPSSNDIKWFYNDAPLPINNDYYALGNDNKQLMISNVSSKLIIGQYHINVTTTQGTQSTYINVSYFDPPVVTLIPDVTELVVNESETVIFNCTVSSVLSISLNWYKGGGGILIDSNNGFLVLSNVSGGDAGDYYCEAVDIDGIYTITKTFTLTVQYAPVVTVQTIHEPEPQSSLSNTYPQDGPNRPTYFCSVSAVPPATTVQWYFNGNKALPSGVEQTEDSSDNNIKYKLHWTKSVIYEHNGTYSCHARNIIGESIANVYVTVQAFPHITTIYSNDLSTSFDSSTITFTNSLSSPTDSNSVTCVGYGLPYPSIHWVDSDGHELTNIYYINSCGLYSGIAVSTLTNATQVGAQEPLYCQVMNEIGNETRVVSIIQDQNRDVNESNLSPNDVPSVSSNIVNIRLKFNVNTCIGNLNSVRIPLKSVLKSIVQTCNPMLEVSLSFSNDGCGDSSLFVPIIVVSIQTSSSSNTNSALQAISQWIDSNPIIFAESHPYQLDPNCTLIASTQKLPEVVDSSIFVCTSRQSVSQGTPTATTSATTPEPSNNTPPPTTSNNSQMVIWLSIVGVILFLLLVVVASLIVVLYLCAKTVKKSGRGVLVGASKPLAWPDSDCIHMNAIHHTSSQELQDGSSPFRNRLQQSTSLDSSKDGIEVGGMQENPEYVMGPQLELLKTLSDEQIDLAPPNYQSVADNNTRDSGYIETMRSSAALVSQETMISAMPIHEKLYHYGGGGGCEEVEDPTYAEIRPDARKQSPTDNHHHQHIHSRSLQHSSNTDVHSRMMLSQSEATRRATLPSNMRYSPNRRPQYNGPTSPPHYTKPHQYTVGSRQHRSITTSSPVVNQQPMPYSQPVSSMGSLRNVGIHNSKPPTNVFRPPTRPIANRSLSTPNTIKEEPSVTSADSSPLKSVQETTFDGDDGGVQQWYNDVEDNSDIVTPTTPIVTYDEINSISPYAITLSSQVEPHPYSQPGSDWQLSTVTGGSSPSTIRPNQLPVSRPALVNYETIDV